MALPDAPCDAFGAFVALAAGRPAAMGPLAGVRLAVKDNIAVQGLPYTAGLPLFQDRLGPADAAAVRTLQAAGAVVCGVARTDAGGFGVATPRVRNPAYPRHIAGGSSGGPAAAVAAGLADLGLGTDTGGSARIPAACCGLYGFKPSHGAISTDGVWPLAPELDTVGLMARDLDLIRRAYAALAGRDADRGRAPRELVIGVDAGRLAHTDRTVAAAFLRTVDAQRDRFKQVRLLHLPGRGIVQRIHAACVLLAARDIYCGIDRDFSDARYGPTAGAALRAALLLDAAQARRAREDAAGIRQEWEQSMRDVDYVLTPTLAVPRPLAGSRHARLLGRQIPLVHALTAETALANLVGAPAISIPCGRSLAGLQLSGRAGCDGELIEAAAAFSAPR